LQLFARQHHNRDIAQTRIGFGPQFLADAKAVNPRQDDVEENQAWMFLAGKPQRGLSVGGRQNVHALGAQ
jgi:hypothetical protein